MKERPILFSAPMVRAILSGTKTQTRRAMKPQTTSGPHDIATVISTPDSLASFVRQRCPYGQPGDRLWVREAHWWFEDEHDPVTGYSPPKLTVDDVVFKADGEDPRKVWRPSIHMPRWASRITLEVNGVRVERLQDISIADAMAEGVVECNENLRGLEPCMEWRYAYEDIWEQINGDGSWGANPWVWVVEFKRVPQGEVTG